MESRVKSVLLKLLCLPFFISVSCNWGNGPPTKEEISGIHLKRGEIILCGAPNKQFGQVEFITSCTGRVKEDFNLAIELLHSFEYDQAEKAFAKVIDEEPGCAMAYWGVAMCNNHPLWSPPSGDELKKGAKAIGIARSVTHKTKRESAYIEAMALFFNDFSTVNHYTRSVRFEKGMEQIYKDNPADKEAAIFYALSLDGSSDPTDRSFSNQKKAGAILTSLYPKQPDHPGIVHYIIHTYDYPELAQLGLQAARRYASIAPASAHAQHMPSHIFTRLGLWDESIKSNLISISNAKCYALAAGIRGTWDEELHGMDYLEYAYLQKAENKKAKQQVDYLKTIEVVSPVNFKDAYAFAAIPARYVLENKQWENAASLEIHPATFPWQKFPWQKAIFYFTRILGLVHVGRIDSAKSYLTRLKFINQTLTKQNDLYKANLVNIQVDVATSWILLKEGKDAEALKDMLAAADMEDKTQKNPVTPGEVIPARELLGDMLLQINKPAAALVAYETDLDRHPNRFNGLYGAAISSQKLHNLAITSSYFKKLLTVSNSPDSYRPEIDVAKKYLKSQIPQGLQKNYVMMPAK